MNTLDQTLNLLAAREARRRDGAGGPAQTRSGHCGENGEGRNAQARTARRRLAGRGHVRWHRGARRMLWLPLVPSPALAFAQVQQHFRDFRTLRFDVEQRMNGKVLMKSRVHVTRDGNVRTDVGDIVSVIVNSSERRVMTLHHPARVAHGGAARSCRPRRMMRWPGSRTFANSRARHRHCRRPG